MATKASSFCKAVLADLQVDAADDTSCGCLISIIRYVMRDVPDIYSGTTRNIVIREDDYTFWTTILEEMSGEDTYTSTRVAVVGSPGIGKSTTVAFAIRLLLEQNKTVVYKYRTVDETGYYAQFTPTVVSAPPAGPSPSADAAVDPRDVPQVEIELFPEGMKSSEIPSLLHPETYYVIDPGKTKDNCSPGPFVVCRVIIVASPDERHWGGPAFMKDDQTGLGGDIRYFPAWSLPQLQAASTRLSKVQFQDGDVPELYSIFGGIPRQVFAPNRKERNRTNLKTKVESMTHQKLCSIVTGQINRHSGFGIDQFGGGIVEFRPKENFKEFELMLASSSILKWVRNRFMSSIWTAMATYPSPMSWQLLEDYVLHALQKSNQYAARACVGKSDAAYNQLQILLLGHCTRTALKCDCTAALIDEADLIAFYSSDKQDPLYDIIYRTGTIYHAFQVTEGKSHPAKQHQINNLVRRLQIGSGGRELRLYYAAHEGVFDNFVTDPVAPAGTINGVSIYHLKLVQGLLD